VWFEIHINPLVDAQNGLLGVSIVFFDVTGTRALLDKVVQTNHQLEAAYEELQSTNEELETTNEELQSTVEELETTNEELQSTNEELETMNEELQSTNDELHTINDTLRECSVELDHANSFLDSLINSVQLGLAVVDRDMRVLVWNQCCEDLWGLRAAEAVGTSFTSLDIGLPLETVRPLIGNAFVDSGSFGETLVEAVNRRGRSAQVRVTCAPFRATDGAVGGALLLMEVVGQQQL
jgi:two-component system CheB/CheR fusion protein